MKAVKKAGRLANGAERGKGTIVHLAEDSNAAFSGSSLCGQRPSNCWVTVENPQSICKKCLNKVIGDFNNVNISRVFTDENGYVKEIVFDPEIINTEAHNETTGPKR